MTLLDAFVLVQCDGAGRRESDSKCDEILELQLKHRVLTGGHMDTWNLDPERDGATVNTWEALMAKGWGARHGQHLCPDCLGRAAP